MAPTADSIHLSSPFIYAMLVMALKKVSPCPDNATMKALRYYHNVVLTVLSAAMLAGIVAATQTQGKHDSLDSYFCQPWEESSVLIWSTQAFLWSKYLEWGDTVFLHLSGRPLSWLQLTHHATTALLAHLNLSPFASAYFAFPQALNCLVHVFMYWYFAYPRGVLRRYRKLITQSQIVQHVSVLVMLVGAYTQEDTCPQNPAGLYTGVACYTMYLVSFVSFYVSAYLGVDASKGGGKKQL